MRVLVTGATGVFGRALCERLTARGDHVVAMARRAPSRAIAAAEFRAGDIRDADATRDAMAGCDAVAHLAWAFAPLATPEETAALDVGGTRNVVEAMAATGCRRLVFSSSVLAYGAIPRAGRLVREDEPLRPDPDHLYSLHKAQAEDVIFSSGVEAVAVRAGVTAGRAIDDNTIYKFLAGPALIDASDGDRAWQLIHQEDVGRFFADAIHAERTGPVNLAAPDLLPFDDFAGLLGRPLFRVPSSVLHAGLALAWKRRILDFAPSEAMSIAFMPKVDTARLRDEWGWSCGWTSREVAEDVARGVAGRITLMDWKEFRVPGAVPMPRSGRPSDGATADVPPPAPDLSPLAASLRAESARAVADEVAPYLSVDRAAGFSQRSRVALRRRWTGRRFPSTVRGLEAALRRENTTAVAGSSLDDPALHAHLGLAADRVVHAWTVAAVGAVLGGGSPDTTHWPAEALDTGETRGTSRAPGEAASLVHDAMLALRPLVLEAGRRLAARGLIGDAEDALALTISELRDPPPDLARRIRARRSGVEGPTADHA